jgi:hypothetical protein
MIFSFLSVRAGEAGVIQSKRLARLFGWSADTAWPRRMISGAARPDCRQG